MSNYEILPGDNKEKEDLIHQNKTTPWQGFVNIIRSITVEPLGIVAFIVMIMYTLVSKQYVYDWVAKSNGFNTSTQHSACDNANTSSLEDKVSAETSEWVLYLNIAGFVPSLVTTLVLGSWGDIVGRRLPFFVGFFGYFMMVLCFLIIVIFKLPVYYLLIGRIICGICGNYSVILGCLFAYLADTSTKENRTVKVAIGEASIGFGGIIGSLLSGFWVEKQGYIPPFIFLNFLVLATLLYILFVLPESKVVNSMPLSLKLKLLFSLKPFKEIKNVFTGLNHNLKIIGITVCFLFEIIVVDGFTDVMVIYQLSPPFCWSSVLVGYSAALKLCSLLMSLIFIKMVTKYITDNMLVLIGSLSNVSACLFFAFSNSTWMLFVGLATGCLSALTIIVYRSIPSKLVSTDGQGSIFALLALAESISEISASFIMNPVYAATVAWFSGFVFVLMAILEILVFTFFCFVYNQVKHDIISTN